MAWALFYHLVSLDAFLDVSIMAGFSFGAQKAKQVVTQGSSLGRVLSRERVAADEERAQAVRDFAPLRTRVHVHHFAGSTNWLQQHMPVECAQALKLLGEFLKPGTVFPPEESGGSGGTAGDKAVVAIKNMAGHLIRLSVLDEAAAMDGLRPVGQIADLSGIGWGGACLQMTCDLMGFSVLLTASQKGLRRVNRLGRS